MILKAQEIKMSDIQENFWNPNEVEQQKIDGLKIMIESRGMLQPILLVECAKIEELKDYNTKYMVVDGAHRYKASKELGSETILANVGDFRTLDECKFATISMNAVRGIMDSYRYASVVQEVAKLVDVAELSKRLGVKLSSLQAIVGEEHEAFIPPVFDYKETEVDYRYYKIRNMHTLAVNSAMSWIRDTAKVSDPEVLLSAVSFVLEIAGIDINLCKLDKVAKKEVLSEPEVATENNQNEV
jgi:uncharacterized ParB-like nuclease family protein